MEEGSVNSRNGYYLAMYESVSPPERLYIVAGRDRSELLRKIDVFDDAYTHLKILRQRKGVCRLITVPT